MFRRYLLNKTQGKDRGLFDTDSGIQVVPTMLSKVNTALQFSLLVVALAVPAMNIPYGVEGVTALSVVVSATTVGSALQYFLNPMKHVTLPDKPPGSTSPPNQ
mmetsp:Transcript_72433/g.170364  ORF Transcript_72433/g.170364 Transcript_72433/m.170364 type:complete len:103 (-) Transcript_72433:20-328(-)